MNTDALRGVLRVQEKPREITMEDLCRVFKVHKLSRWRPGTVAYYDAHIKGSVLPQFAGRMVSSLSAREIQGFLDAKLKTVGGATVNKVRQVLSAVLAYAVRMGYLERSPMVLVERARPAPYQPRVLRLHELQAIFASCPEEHRSFITVLALTGLRKSELFRLAWDWVDFERETLLIKVAKVGSQEIPLSPRVRDALVSLGPTRAGVVFPGLHRDRTGKERTDPGKILSDKRWAIRRVLDAAGVDPTGVAFHTFRHSFVTLLEGLPGVTYSVVRALARHSTASPSDITARYLHPTAGQLRAALVQLERAIYAPLNVVLFPQRAGQA